MAVSVEFSESCSALGVEALFVAADADFAQAGATNYCPISNLRKSRTGAGQ